MLFYNIFLLAVCGILQTKCQNDALTLTTLYLQNVDSMKNIAEFNDAQHRGPDWYDDDSSDSDEGKSDLESGITDTSSSSISSSSSSSSSTSSEASSVETKERKSAEKLYRKCVSCPTDMLKEYKNIGIRWICGAYQRARRSFKSECMMRYRNCQDGTMFVKIYDHRCKNDTYHGRHWFYDYKV